MNMFKFFLKYDYRIHHIHITKKYKNINIVISIR